MILSHPFGCRAVKAVSMAGLALLVAATPAGAQRRERVLIVSALDKASGKPVDALAPADVAVREDRVAREVLRVSRATEPIQLAILVDNSAAATRHVANIRDGLKGFVKAVENAEISLVTYADRPTLVADAASKAVVEKAIDRIFAQPNSGGYLLDAIQETSRGFVKRQASRPVIVVVATQGVEFSNEHYDAVLERLREAGAQLHVLQLDEDSRADATEEERYRSIVIDRGTRESGGRREHLLASMALPAALATLAAELNAQYRVVYVRPESLIPPKDVTVSSARPDLEVRGVLMAVK